MLWLTVATLIVVSVPQPVAVDVCEISYVSTQQSCFCQVILWRWQGGDHRVADWSMVSDYDAQRVGCRTIVTWRGAKPGRVSARTFRTTGPSPHDPETADREILPESRRRSYWQTD